MIWFIAGLGLCLLEIFTPGFFVLLFGVAAIITGIASFLGLPLIWQWILFVVLCLVLVLFVRKYFMRLLQLQPTQIANVQGFIGKNAAVIHAIEKGSMKGRVRIEGEDWMAVTEEDYRFESGEMATVVSISGTKLVVGKGL